MSQVAGKSIKSTNKKAQSGAVFFVYILRCKDRSFYCGIAKDMKKRIAQHNAGKGSAYVRSRGGGKVVYWETQKSLSLALKREFAIKQFSRKEKQILIKGFTRLSRKREQGQRQP